MSCMLIVFDKKLQDWKVAKDDFTNEDEAERFVKDYPRFGGDLSRTIREGNWRIIPKEKTNA